MVRLRIRTALAFLLLLLLTTLLPAQDSEDRILDEVVAKVNQTIITMTDLADELRVLRVSLQDELQDPDKLEEEFRKRKSGLLKNVIQNQLLLQKAEELGLTVNIDSQVNQTLERLRQQMGIPSMEIFAQALEQRGTSLEEYRKNLRERLVIDSLLQQMVYSRITLLTPEIDAYYQENASRFQEPAKITLAEILFLKEGQEINQLRSRAEQALTRLQQGEAFESVAKDVSEGPTADKGGEIGEFRVDSLAAALRSGTDGLGAGETSGILETDYGLIIAKVIARVAPKIIPLDDVKQQIQQTLYQQKAQPELKTFLEDLLQQSYIYVAPKYKQEYDVANLAQ